MPELASGRLARVPHVILYVAAGWLLFSVPAGMAIGHELRIRRRQSAPIDNGRSPTDGR